jgi:hypothetical protein
LTTIVPGFKVLLTGYKNHHNFSKLKLALVSAKMYYSLMSVSLKREATIKNYVLIFTSFQKFSVWPFRVTSDPKKVALWVHCYKTFYGCHLEKDQIRWNAYPLLPFRPSLMFAGNARSQP